MPTDERNEKMQPSSNVRVTSALRQEARDYYALCERARALGIPTSLDDPRSPKTIAALRAAISRAQ
jgi:hypothetical protein